MKSRHLFSFAAFSFPDLEPLSEENAKSPGQLITQEAECESLFQAKSSLASSWVCVCFSSFFLSLGTFYLPPRLLPWFTLSFLLPPENI